MKRILLLTVFAAVLSVAGYSQCGGFYDGFESGTYSPTWTNIGALTPSVVTSPAAAGNYALSTTGGSGHLLGLTTSFPDVTPSEISWYMYPNGTTANNYVVAGDVNVGTNNCIMFCYWLGSSGNIRFVSSVSLDYPALQNQWYFIQLKNVDYANRTFDIYIDGVLQYTSFPFRSSTISTLSVFHLYNYTGGTAYYDDIMAGNTPISFDLAGTDISCNGAMDGAINATIYDAQGPVNYTWSNSAITEDISGLSAGTYTLTATDSVGCVAIDSLVISEPTALTATYDSLNPVTCQGNEGTIDLYVSGGVPGYLYNWNSGDTTASLSGLSAGTYVVDLTDTNGCTAQWSVTLSDPQPPVVSTSWTTQSTCNYYLPFALNGGLPAGGTWSGNGVSGNNFDPATATLGSNTLTYSYTDSLNCTGSSTAEVIVDECLGMGELNNLEVSVFPNPASTNVNIRVENGTYSLRLLTLSGQEVTNTAFTGNEYQLSLNGLAAGLYHLEISNELQLTRIKLVVE